MTPGAGKVESATVEKDPHGEYGVYVAGVWVDSWGSEASAKKQAAELNVGINIFIEQIRQSAFAEGAEAMRNKTVRHLDALFELYDGCVNRIPDVSQAIRSLPLPSMGPEREGKEAEPVNQPIGKCKKCGTPTYTDEGFCGVCGH